MAISRKTLLKCLSMKQLKSIASDIGIGNLSTCKKSEILALLVSTRRISTEELLAYYRKDDLKAACINAGLDYKASTKAQLVTRLLNNKEYKYSTKPKGSQTSRDESPKRLQDTATPKAIQKIAHDNNQNYYEPCPKCGKPKHRLMACSACGYSWREDNYSKSTRKSNLVTTKRNPINSKISTTTNSYGQKNSVTTNVSKLSKFKCKFCGTLFISDKHLQNHTWKKHRATLSNKEITRQNAARKKSVKKLMRENFGPDTKRSEDIYSRGLVISGGGFETNRRKH